MSTTTQAQEVTSWAAEVVADSSGRWSRNGLRFATAKEAWDSGHELMSRWFAVTDVRAAPTKDPVNYRFVDGKNVPLEG